MTPPASNPQELILQTHLGVLLQFWGPEDSVNGDGFLWLGDVFRGSPHSQVGSKDPSSLLSAPHRRTTQGRPLVGRGLRNPTLKTITKSKRKEPVSKQLSPVGMEPIGRGKSNG